MKIGIEAERANEAQKTGVEHYAKQLILHLAQIDQENEYVLYLRYDPESWFTDLPKNFRVKKLGWGPIHFPYLWTQLRLSLEMLIAPPDVLFVPAASLPIIHPRRSYTTIHDIAWKIYPETFKSLKRWYLEFTTWFAALSAKKVIAVSEATKKDLEKYYLVNPKKIAVVHHGYTVVNNLPHSASGHPLLARRGVGGEVDVSVPEKFVLFLSTIQPRKNLIGAIEAMKAFREKHKGEDYKLLVVGKKGWKSEESVAAIEANKDFVEYIGHVTDEQRELIYSKASCMLMPSFYEGFGMWILEAFDAGVPLLTSNVSSMPEIGGRAAVYFDPHEKTDIVRALEEVLLDKEKAQSLKALGKERLKEFSWGKCAKETLEVLMS